MHCASVGPEDDADALLGFERAGTVHEGTSAGDFHEFCAVPVDDNVERWSRR